MTYDLSFSSRISWSPTAPRESTDRCVLLHMEGDVSRIAADAISPQLILQTTQGLQALLAHKACKPCWLKLRRPRGFRRNRGPWRPHGLRRALWHRAPALRRLGGRMGMQPPTSRSPRAPRSCGSELPLWLQRLRYGCCGGAVAFPLGLPRRHTRIGSGCPCPVLPETCGLLRCPASPWAAKNPAAPWPSAKPWAAQTPGCPCLVGGPKPVGCCAVLRAHGLQRTLRRHGLLRPHGLPKLMGCGDRIDLRRSGDPMGCGATSVASVETR